MREDFQLNCWQFLKSAPGCKTIVREPAAYRQTIRDDSVRFENCLPKNRFATIICPSFGGIAQLVERLVRNEKARGSNPLTSSLRCSCLRRQNSYSHRRYRCLDERGDRTGSAGKTKVIVITAKRIWPRAAAMPAGPFHETVQRREILAIVHDALDRV
jgi:hypothetical protein